MPGILRTGVYVLINSILFLINITTSPDVLWFYWPLLGWGIGIVMHAVYVFDLGHWFGPDWEEKTQYDLVAIQIIAREGVNNEYKQKSH